MELDFINNGPKSFDSYEEIFNDLADKTFSHLHKEENYLIDVSIVNNEEIHKINKQYRHVDRPTDVISFAFLDDKDEVIQADNSLPISLGQIIISYEKAETQAVEFGHSLRREMSFLFVHGLLHLLGFDHMNEEDEEKMFKTQDEILGGRFDG